MANKENKGGVLKNDQVEQDLKARGKEENKSYTGSQDTGDKDVRQTGTAVQRADGRPPRENGEQE